jgi:hypothetical protein
VTNAASSDARNVDAPAPVVGGELAGSPETAALAALYGAVPRISVSATADEVFTMAPPWQARGKVLLEVAASG